MGSSASSSGGRLTSARAMATRCCCPPESCDGSWSMRSPRPDALQQFLGPLAASAVSEMPVVRVRQRHDHVVQGAGPRQQVEVLEDEADLAVAQHGPLVGRGIRNLLPVQPILAGGRVVQAAQDVHQRALAGAAGAHQGDQFAAGNSQRNALEHRHVHLAEVVRLVNVLQFYKVHEHPLNLKPQATNLKQAPITNDPKEQFLSGSVFVLVIGTWRFGHCLELGACYLEFLLPIGISTMQLTFRRHRRRRGRRPVRHRRWAGRWRAGGPCPCSA